MKVSEWARRWPRGALPAEDGAGGGKRGSMAAAVNGGAGGGARFLVGAGGGGVDVGRSVRRGSSGSSTRVKEEDGRRLRRAPAWTRCIRLMTRARITRQSSAIGLVRRVQGRRGTSGGGNGRNSSLGKPRD
jgi:hypothetical protein